VGSDRARHVTAGRWLGLTRRQSPELSFLGHDAKTVTRHHLLQVLRMVVNVNISFGATWVAWQRM
jgi:hypothetical protein